MAEYNVWLQLKMYNWPVNYEYKYKTNNYQSSKTDMGKQEIIKKVWGHRISLTTYFYFKRHKLSYNLNTSICLAIQFALGYKFLDRFYNRKNTLLKTKLTCGFCQK